MKRPLTQPRLPDVLVGTAILALVAAALAPTIANARQARGHSLMAGVHAARTAALMYSHDYDSTTHPRLLQTLPFPDTCAQVGEGFVDGEGGCRDTQTGLTWTQRQQPWSWWDFYSARDGCLGLSLADHDDWRLPSKDEFLTMVAHNGAAHLQVDDPHYDNWTSTLGKYRGVPSAWLVDFTGYASLGAIPNSKWAGVSYMAYRCVRP